MSGKRSAQRSALNVEPDAAYELVYIDVSQIECYEHNPRKAPNAEYDRIKASIRVDGIYQPLVVTQRPDATQYLVHAGGNTRLEILRELSAETSDPRFGAVACLVRPWTREADVLLAHLKENDLRGNLTFVERALAIADAKRFLEAEQSQPLTQSGLVEILTKNGYGVSQALVSQLLYAADRLFPLIPQALENGLGRPQVAKIRSLDRVVRAVWLERKVDTEAEYDLAFDALCRRYDSLDWDIANLRRALEAEVAERAEINIHAVSIEIDARLAGQSVDTSFLRHDDDCDDVTAGSDESGLPRDPMIEDGSDLVAPKNRASSAFDDKNRESTGAHPDASPDVGCDEETDKCATIQSPAVAGAPATLDVKSLRSRLWTLAARLAQRNGLGDLVQPLPHQGMGYMLRDVPDPALVDQLDEDALAQISMIWWHLAACAELTVAPLDVLLPLLPEEAMLKRALAEQNAGLLFASVWTLDPGHIGHRLWRRVDERDWQDLLGLMDAYRSLHKIAATKQQTLWISPP